MSQFDRIPALAVLATVALGLMACETPADKPQQADKVVRDWIAAATSKDGQSYCGLMTPRLLRTITGQSGKKAKTTCEKRVKSGTGKHPFQFDIPKPKTIGASKAQVDVGGRKLRGHVKLKKQKGKLLIDAVH